MKKPLLTTITILFFTTAFSQSKWTNQDYADFISACVVEARAGMSADSAKFYCYCMMSKVEKKHPDPASIGEADFESPEWQKAILSCLGQNWSKEYRAGFLGSCIESAQSGLGEVKAASYCECMMFRMENMFPNSADADKLTSADFQKPEWQKLIKSCLNN